MQLQACERCVVVVPSQTSSQPRPDTPGPAARGFRSQEAVREAKKSEGIFTDHAVQGRLDEWTAGLLDGDKVSSIQIMAEVHQPSSVHVRRPLGPSIHHSAQGECALSWSQGVPMRQVRSWDRDTGHGSPCSEVVHRTSCAAVGGQRVGCVHTGCIMTGKPLSRKQDSYSGHLLARCEITRQQQAVRRWPPSGLEKRLNLLNTARAQASRCQRLPAAGRVPAARRSSLLDVTVFDLIK